MGSPTTGPTLGRRDFLKTGAMAGALAATGGTATLSGCAGSSPESGSGGAPVPFELDEVTIADLQRRMETGELTARRVTELYLERIEAVDRSGPTLRSIIETNPDALEIAEARDRDRARGNLLGPLHGIPVLVKANIGSGDGMATTAGSLALDGVMTPRDAFVVARLRAAGAVLLGKTNLSEWANFRSTRSSSGWSGIGGQCRNPYALDRNTSGSSSGSGGAASANLAAVTIGTETDGSIVSPAGTCGLVGFKPTLGLVSRAGIIPLAHSQDTAGPMTRTVRDAALVLGAIVGTDPDDPITTAAGRADTSYLEALLPDGLRGARIGVVRNRYTGYHPATDALFEEALGVLAAQGAELIDPADIPTAGQFDDTEFEVLLTEFKADIAEYLVGLDGRSPHRTLADLIAYNEANADRELQYFGQEIFTMAQEKGGLAAEAYRTALADSKRLAGPDGIDTVMTRHRLDALVAPTGAPAWPIDLVNGDHYLGGSSSPAAVAGYPNISVPAGFVHGLPVGISFFGRAFSETVLFKLAYAFEQATLHRQAPTFRPSAMVEA